MTPSQRLWPVANSLQPQAAESVHVELTHAADPRITLILPDGVLFGEPGKRDVGIHEAQLLEGGFGEFDLARQSRCRGQPAIGGDEVGALSDRFLRKPHRFVMIASEKLSAAGEISGDR